MTNIEMGEPGGSEPSAPDGDREPYARRKAAELLLCAARLAAPHVKDWNGRTVTEALADATPSAASKEER